MRWTHWHLQTRRTPPDTPWPGHAYLMQAGYVRPVGPGLHDWSPLGVRLRRRLLALLEATVTEALGDGLAPLHCAVVRPGSESPPIAGAAASGGAAWFTPALLGYATTQPPLQPGDARDYLGINVAQRDEPRPRGLFRCRSFTLVEGISLTADAQAAGERYARWAGAWRRLSTELGLSLVEGECEDATGTLATAFLWPHDSADEAYLHCPTCNTWYHPDVAPFHRDPPPFEAPAPLAEVPTPECTTIDALCAYLGVPPERTAKSLFLVAGGEPGYPVVAVVRGDMNLSLAKVRRIVGPVPLRPATAEEIRRLGAVPGYGSPMDIRGALVLVDITVANTPNLVAGANREGYHVRNVNVGRDILPHVMADIAQAPAAARCPTCGRPYETRPAWTLATVTYPFQRQTRVLMTAPGFAPDLAQVAAPLPEPAARDAAGKGTSPWMVRSALELERLIAVLAETHHDERGLTWPRDIAPFDVHMVVLAPRRGEKAAEVHQKAEDVYTALTRAGLLVLLDDRNASAGVKFNDADLLGCPFRITVSPRTLSQQAVEVTPREGGSLLVPLDQVVEAVL